MSEKWNIDYDSGFNSGAEHEHKKIINILKDNFSFAMDCETQECLQNAANSITWSERWQLSFNQLIELIKGETNELR
jgi:hypothetical protein